MDRSAAPVSFTHRGAIAAVAAAGLVASWIVAAHRPVPGGELRLERWINAVPAAVGTALFPIMQLGTFGAPLLVAAGIAAFRRDGLLALATVAVGWANWQGAKAIKGVVERGRPIAYLPDIHLREAGATGFGYISGHSAVAAGSAVMVAATVPARYRWIPVLAAGLVGAARMIDGVHLPIDVIGGWSFGTLVGLAGLRLVDLRVPRGRPNIPQADAPTP
ncbi:phosphatase PAP2 family protein [Aquihabitans sp. McL0605]|uniref:phosphatase PAP2 family protein n=1 Tax=Aquihabitans sp. McL0605 TaxID=3415671 RepID=UPI003CF3ACC3